MNELLNKLKGMALDWATETLNEDELNDYEWSVAIDKKFAELVIKECIKLVADADSRSFVYTTFDQAQANACKEHCIKNIKQKFDIL